MFSLYPSLLQEGQVLECSLINSIRVGAVPKVRPQEVIFLARVFKTFRHQFRLKHIPFLYLASASTVRSIDRSLVLFARFPSQVSDPPRTET